MKPKMEIRICVRKRRSGRSSASVDGKKISFKKAFGLAYGLVPVKIISGDVCDTLVYEKKKS